MNEAEKNAIVNRCIDMSFPQLFQEMRNRPKLEFNDGDDGGIHGRPCEQIVG